MLIINSSDVRFWPAPENGLDHQPEFLEYFSNSYELISTFPVSQKAQAMDLWCELTDRSSTICLLVQEENAYSVWGLTEHPRDFRKDTINDDETVSTDTLVNTSRWLGRSLWLVITDLAGTDRAQSFGVDVIDSSLPIQSWVEIQTAMPSAAGPPQLIAPEKIAVMKEAIDEFQRLTAKYLGQSCAQQVIQDLIANLASPSAISH